MKQTAVELFKQRLIQRGIGLNIKDFEEAKEMEKEQIMDAWEDGQNSFSTINAKQYYKETFNNK
jgi:hypothetical protein